MPFDQELKQLIREAEIKATEYFVAQNLREAEPIVRQVLKIDENNIISLKILGIIALKTNHYKEAKELLEKVLILEPDNSENLTNLGAVYSNLRKSDQAEEILLKSISINPHDVLAYINLCSEYKGQNQYQKAENLLRKGIKNTNSSRIYFQLGALQAELGQIQESIINYEKTLELEPDFSWAHFNLGASYLLTGNFKKGWEGYEYRKVVFPDKTPKIQKPFWRSKVNKGNIILIFNEQGVGDIIQFIRYVKTIKKLFNKVILECPPFLRTIFEPLGVELVEKISENEFDICSSLLSVPRVIGTTLDTIPSYDKYLHPVKVDVGNFCEKNRFNIGICWAGSPYHRNDHKRSCHLFHFGSISRIPGVRLYGLVKDMRPRWWGNRVCDLTSGSEGVNITHLSERMEDFNHTANIIEKLDLVISVDTAIVHLAGAIGKPVWVLLPYVPCWRWMLNRTDSPWYPSVKLFRQKSLDNWEGLFKEVEEELCFHLSKDHRRP